jgi:hypothetical protein
MTTRSTLLLETCLAAALACAPVAYAGDDGDRGRGPRWSHHKHGPPPRHHAPRYHGSWCPGSGGHAHGYRHDHGRPYAGAPYLCSPCGSRFGSRSDLHRHVHHHHHVPWAFIPHVVVQVSLGWIFHG